MSYELHQLAPEDFPPLLHEIPDSPKDLWAKGALPIAGRTLLTVVGTRRMTPYGKQACEHIISGLAGSPITIVSGLALGVDACAHRAALKAGLPTIAVPGSGLDSSVLYPRSHVSLAHEILENDGALLSEFKPTFRATQWSFPRRNRIMAGMSHGVLIIEAEEKSGTLITMRLAADYNREVMAVPGSIFSTLSQGSHMILKRGAALITCAEDVLETLGLDSAAPLRGAAPDLSPPEQNVWDVLETPQPRNSLLQQLNMPTADAQTLLSVMELKGYITEELGEIRRAL